MNRRTHRIARCLGTALAATVAVAAVLTAMPATAKTPRAPHNYGSEIEGLAGYQPQRKCSPTAKPGTVAFSKLLLRTYKNSRSLGIVRACNVGGTSEHKEGRAFDWGVSAFNRQDRRSVNAVMHWLLKKDKYGNRYAMARRLGIQYMIWNRRIWGSYSASSGWRRYTGSSPHTDHVHFSMSWKGARKLTSFWHPKRFGQSPKPPKPKPEPEPTPNPTPKPNPPEPKPKPGPGPNHGPSKPGPRKKSLPEPKPRRSLRAGPAMVSERLQVSTRRRDGVVTHAALQKGHTYLVEVSGTFQYDNSKRALADAECSTARRSEWQRNRSLRGDYWLDHLDVYIDGHDLYSDGDNGQDCDTDSHTYRSYYQADRSGRVPLQVWDPTGHGNNHGKLRAQIVDVQAVRDKMAWKVPADAVSGATSPGSLQAGVEYQVTVSGVWSAGGGYRADAECSISREDRTWRRDRSADPNNPAADYFDVLQDKDDLGLEPLTDNGGRCDENDHAYRYTFTPSETRPVNFRVDDPTGYRNNSGDLRVKVQPYVEPAPEPIVTEQVTVDSSTSTPVQTGQSYPRGSRLLVRVTGTYRWSSGLSADAECSQTPYNGRTYWGNWRGGDGDLAVNGVIGTWYPDRDSGRGCDDAHGYTREVRVDTTGPLSFAVSDNNYADNSGSLTLTVEEIR